ncbi:hypothetical protein BGY98DRAFT_1189093, partial [Russula aff. rugulosa BPL654]
FARRAYVPNTDTVRSAPVIDRRHLDPIPLKHNVGCQSDSKKPPQIDDKDVVVRVVGVIVYVGISRPAELAAGTVTPCTSDGSQNLCLLSPNSTGDFGNWVLFPQPPAVGVGTSPSNAASVIAKDSAWVSTTDTATASATYSATASATDTAFSSATDTAWYSPTESTTTSPVDTTTDTATFPATASASASAVS